MTTPKKARRYLRNKELSDPKWVHQKQQDFFNFKAAMQRLEWGSAYLPEACGKAMWNIRMEIECMDEPIKAWKVEKPEWVKLGNRRTNG